MSNKPLDAGPELDAAVARALGWDFTITSGGHIHLIDHRQMDRVSFEGAFNPSHRIEIAMDAAEECDLFMRFDLSKTRLRWQMWEFQSATKYGEPRDGQYAYGSTAAETISRAIVRMHEEEKPS